MNIVVKATVLASVLAAVACGTAKNNTSTAKDLIGPGALSNLPEQVTTVIPTGPSQTLMLGFFAPIVSSALEIHTTCSIQLTQLAATYDNGLVGYLQQSSYSPNVWVAPSGATHSWSAVQFTTNNFGLPTYCTYTVTAPQTLIAVPFAAPAANAQ